MKTSTTVLRCNGVGSARKWLVLAMVAAMMVSVQASSVAEAATTSTGLDNKNDLPLSLQTVIEKAQSNLRERELHPGHRVRARPAPLTVKKTTAGIARKKTPVATKKQNDSRIRKKATAGFRKKASRPKSNNRTRTGGTPPAPPSEPMGGTRGRTNARPPPRPVTTYRDPYGGNEADTHTPTVGESTIGPSEGLSTIGPSEGLSTIGPSEGETTIGPSEGETTIGPSEGETTIGPSEGETTVAPSERETTFSAAPTPAGGDTPVPSPFSSTDEPTGDTPVPSPSSSTAEPTSDTRFPTFTATPTFDDTLPPTFDKLPDTDPPTIQVSGTDPPTFDQTFTIAPTFDDGSGPPTFGDTPTPSSTPWPTTTPYPTPEPTLQPTRTDIEIPPGFEDFVNATSSNVPALLLADWISWFSPGQNTGFVKKNRAEDIAPGDQWVFNQVHVFVPSGDNGFLGFMSGHCTYHGTSLLDLFCALTFDYKPAGTIAIKGPLDALVMTGTLGAFGSFVALSWTATPYGDDFENPDGFYFQLNIEDVLEASA